MTRCGGSCSPSVFSNRLKMLRDKMSEYTLDCFIIPRADEYGSKQGESSCLVSKSSERLHWLTGFTGSTGVAVVLLDRAAMFVDGRYLLQSAEQIDTDAYEIINCKKTPVRKWLQNVSEVGWRIGFDPRLHTVSDVCKIKEALLTVRAELVPLSHNLVDLIWTDRQFLKHRSGSVFIQPISVSGTAAAEKLCKVQSALVELRVQSTVLTDLDAIAWLFNIRGEDIEFTPVVHAIAFISVEPGNSCLFMDEQKLSVSVRQYLEQYVSIMHLTDFYDVLSELIGVNERVLVDPNKVSVSVEDVLAELGAHVIKGESPVVMLKAVKTQAELNGTRAAHLRDGIAMVNFLKWFDEEAVKGNLDELTVIEALKYFRQSVNMFLDLSFDSIVGTGPNGAIVHYKANERTNRRIEKNSVTVIDSGAQFIDGTTDVTRTVVVGNVSDEIRDRATRVLKGHIALARTRFPAGTSGSQLDTLARLHLWYVGLDYDHCTGHGVGSCLSVHEAPQSISRTGYTALVPGMILSNEPGYYKSSAYGIRLESLLVVTDLFELSDGDFPVCAFEILTMVPIDYRLIDLSMMTPIELAWLNEYHRIVMANLCEYIDSANVLNWLENATRPL